MLKELRLISLPVAEDVVVDSGAPTPCVDCDGDCRDMNSTEYREGGIFGEEVGGSEPLFPPWVSGGLDAKVLSRHCSWCMRAVR